MNQDKFLMFQNRLLKVFRHIGRQARRQDITCYRLYDHDLPEFPFCIEFYEDKLYVAEYRRHHGMSDEQHESWLQQSLDVIVQTLSVPKENIYVKIRQRKTDRLGQYQKIDKEKEEFIAQENGLKFIINPENYLDTGLFLDHRITRMMVREQSRNKKMLNLFAYTGSFSVYAAAGGASEIVTVDLSRTYLDWAQRNMTLNGFNKEEYSFIHADVKDYLKTIAPTCFDIIVMDPPTFSNSKRMEGILDIQRDHAGLINDCLHGMKEGAALYFSTNYSQFVLEVEKISTSKIKDITSLTTPFDFEGKLARQCYLIKK